MTMPDGDAGLDASFSPYGQTNTLSSLAGFTQDAITEAFQAVLQGNTVLQGASSQFFDVILGGFRTLTNFLSIIVQALTGVAGGGLADLSAFAKTIVDGLTNVLAFAQKIIDTIINSLTGLDTTGNPLSEIWLLFQPLQIIGNLAQMMDTIGNDLGGRVGSLETKLSAVQLSLTPGITETGGYDNCTSAAKFIPVSPFPAPTPTGWGALTAETTSVSLYADSPMTDRHGAGIEVKARTVGLTRLHIASDAAMTNWVGLELNAGLYGADTVSVVTGTGPTTGIAYQKTISMRIPNNSFWEIRYDPYDEDNPDSNTFYVFMNGTPVAALTWQDDGNVVIHGPDHLGVGVTLNGLNSPTRRGFTITNFTYIDWLSAAPQ